MPVRKSSLVVLVLLLSSAPAGAQITVSSLTEMQRGRIPGADSTALSTLYEQFNVDYANNDLQAGLRAEVFNAWGTDRGMVHLSQKFIRWTHGSTYLVAGNYYAILGRGLTLRAFELPGVVLESQVFRRRYTPSRDIEGSLASWTGDRAEIKALIGRPVKSDIPPGVPNVDRRQDWVAGGEVSLRPVSPLKAGATFVRLLPGNADESLSTDKSQAWSGLAEVDFTSLLGLGETYGSFYGEYAKRADAEEGHGLYLSGNAGGSRLGISLEYKNYDNFVLEVNDPPSLVREHTSVILNRSTHVLLPATERGYQIEATYTLPALATLTANLSYARNDLTEDLIRVFKERYLGVDFEKFLPSFSATVFYDWGQDELKGISKHRTGGLLLEGAAWPNHTLGLDFQVQRATRPPSFTDIYTALSWQHPLGVSIALIVDRTSDPLEVDDPTTLTQIETGARTWWAATLSARFAGRYEALLFAGRRRGGTACTSGTCYQVLPFKGLEIRFTTHF